MAPLSNTYWWPDEPTDQEVQALQAQVAQVVLPFFAAPAQDPDQAQQQVQAPLAPLRDARPAFSHGEDGTWWRLRGRVIDLVVPEALALHRFVGALCGPRTPSLRWSPSGSDDALRNRFESSDFSSLTSPRPWSGVRTWACASIPRVMKRRSARARGWTSHALEEESSKGVLHGAVCLRGTRIPVSVVLDNLAAGETPAAILDEYPSLTLDHVRAVIACAAELACARIVPLPA